MTATGAVVWITGLSGVGKTTVAEGVCERLRAAGETPVVLDGDALRAILPVRVGHRGRDRLRLAHFYARLARDLSDQGLVVVCATVSLYHEIHVWNRANVPRYLEVWLRAPVDALRRRGARDELYGSAAGPGSGSEPGQVVGVSSPAEFPRNADVVIDNHGRSTPGDAVERIVAALSVVDPHTRAEPAA